jgi:hypothetical protein
MKQKLVNMMLVISMLALFVGTVSAETLGEQWTVMGYNGGWMILVLGILVGLVAAMVKMAKAIKGPLLAICVVLIIGGIVMATVTVPDTTTADTTSTTGNCCDFEFTGSAITSGGDYITTTTWNENTNTLTIPLTVADSSDGNLTGDCAGVNITLEALGLTTDTNCVYTITSDYSMKYGGETVIDKTGNDYRAEITTEDGTEYITDKVQIAAGSNDWINISWFFVNGTSGGWVSELSQVGDELSWYATIENACGEKQTITVHAIVVSYTA